MSPGQAVFAGVMIIMVMNMVPVTPVISEAVGGAQGEYAGNQYGGEFHVRSPAVVTVETNLAGAY
jgi:hypothetical protein